MYSRVKDAETQISHEFGIVIRPWNIKKIDADQLEATKPRNYEAWFNIIYHHQQQSITSVEPVTPTTRRSVWDASDDEDSVFEYNLYDPDALMELEYCPDDILGIINDFINE